MVSRVMTVQSLDPEGAVQLADFPVVPLANKDIAGKPGGGTGPLDFTRPVRVRSHQLSTHLTVILRASVRAHRSFHGVRGARPAPSPRRRGRLRYRPACPFMLLGHEATASGGPMCWWWRRSFGKGGRPRLSAPGPGGSRPGCAGGPRGANPRRQGARCHPPQEMQGSDSDADRDHDRDRRPLSQPTGRLVTGRPPVGSSRPRLGRRTNRSSLL